MKTQKIYDVAILGAGFAGLGMGVQLKKANIDNFIIFEKMNDVGGVWRDNTYPGAACDIPARLYCYSYYPFVKASEAFVKQPEILEYIHEFTDHFVLRPHIKMNSEITTASWLDDEKVWHISLTDGSEYKARTFIPAWGHLGFPSIPDFKGLEDFGGDYFHSARWNHNVDLTGKHVACIGTAASSVQVVPEVAKIAKELTVFQRTPNWMLPRNSEKFSEEEITQLIKNPDLYQKIRHDIYNELESHFAAFTPNSEVQKQAIQASLDFLEEMVPDPKLREKLTPHYGYGCKRILPNSKYYPTLTQDHVHLETSGINQITKEGIITNDGKTHKLDVIIFSTGFKTQNQPFIEINGLNHRSLAKEWRHGEDAEAYIGMTVSGYPNLFLMLGPNTGIGHNSMILLMEIQQRYIIEALKDYLPKNEAIDIKKEVSTQFNKDLQDQLSKTTFTSGCTSWYQNDQGKVTSLWSGTVNDYRNRVATYNPDEYHYL